jgi:hypothetical protein
VVVAWSEYCPEFQLEGLRKTTINVSHESRWAGRYFETTPNECKSQAGMLEPLPAETFRMRKSLQPLSLTKKTYNAEEILKHVRCLFVEVFIT